MKRHYFKKVLSLLMATALCVGLLPMQSMAVNEEKSVVVENAAEKISENGVIIPAEVTVGADYGESANAVKENIINGSGMSDADTEWSVEATCNNNGFWHSKDNPGEGAWVQVDLGEIYPLKQMWVWNMNQATWGPDRGFKNVKIEYSADGKKWEVLTTDKTFTGGNENYPFQFAKADGSAAMQASNLNDGKNSPVSFGGVTARYVKITAAPTAGDGSWGATYYGLSELRFIAEEIPAVLDKNLAVYVGTQKTLTARVNFQDAELTDVKDEENKTLTKDRDYTVDADSVTFSADYVKNLAVGTYTYTLSFNDKKNTTDTIILTVKEKEPGLYLSQHLVRIAKDGTAQLTANVLPESKTVTWTSENPAVATVDENGNVNAVASGTTVITATAGEYTADCTVVVDGYLRTWYNKPANDWSREALPIGNGNVGGMVFGKTQTEQIQVNEITLWSGGAHSSGNYAGGNKAGAYKALKPIQDKMFEKGGYPYGVEGDVGALLGNANGYGSYQTLGDIYMDLIGAARTSTPENYVRELDMEDGMVRVSYDSAGVHFGREYFASFPGNVMAFRLTADREDAISFKLDYNPGAGRTQVGKRAEDDSIFYQGKVNSSQMAFAVQLKVIAPSADIACNADGTISVENGEDVLVLMAAGTNYDINESKNIDSIDDFEKADCDYLDNNDPDGNVAASKVAERINKAAELGYAQLMKRHMEDFQNIFGRVTLDLGDNAKAELPTDQMVNDYKTNGRNGYTEMVLFQFARYLMMSSSRDSLPANLQGIWNNSNTPPWNSDYHFNINMQMNYWTPFVANMAETCEPLVTFLDAIQHPGQVTAKEHSGVDKGWVFHTQVTPLGMTAPGWEFYWGWAPGNSAWICNNLWDYYQFTKDPEVLERIYPIMKGNSEFWLGYMIEDPRTCAKDANGAPIAGTGELVVAPGGSPEHGPVGVGTTYDMSLAYMVMNDTITAAKLLEQDADFQKELQAALDRMHPYQIGADGQLKEWREETTYPMPGADPDHLCIGHLTGMFPGTLITKENGIFSEYYDAAVKALELRGNGDGFSAGGWSKILKAATWAHIGDTERPIDFIEQLVNGAIEPNLFDHIGFMGGKVFQIDGNYGVATAMSEMLLQSHQGFIEPVPALPEQWADGSYTGLKARGNFEVDADWTSSQLNNLTVRSGSGEECVVRYPNISKADFEGAEFTVVDVNTVKFATTKGGEYKFTNIPAQKPVESIQVKSENGVTLLEKVGQSITCVAEVSPATADDQRVIWKVTGENGETVESVTIDEDGVLTATDKVALENVKVIATAKDSSGVKGELLIKVATDHTGGTSKNVVYKKPVTVSGVETTNAGYPLKNVNDGSTGTRLASTAQTDENLVFEFDLQGTKIIDRAEFYDYYDVQWCPTPRVEKVSIQIPDAENPGNWKTIAEKSDGYQFVGSTNGYAQMSLTFDAVITDKVRVVATDKEKSLPTIWEIEVYGVNPPTNPADKEALVDKITATIPLTEEDFANKAAWNAYQTARETAVDVANNPAATQDEVDQALAGLIASLPKKVDKSELQNLYEANKDKTNDNYTTDSWNAFTTARTKAKEVLDNQKATQGQVDGALIALQNAVKGLVKKADKTLLIQLAGEAGKLSEADYTAESWKTFKGALDAANTVIADENATTEAVKNAYDALSQAMQDLDEKDPVVTVNKKNLEIAIGVAETIVKDIDQYVSTTVKGLKELLADAKVVYADEKATQADVDAKAEALLKKTEEAKLKADKDELQKAVKAAKEVDTTKYTEESVAAFTEALAKAEAVMADETLSQDKQTKVNEALNALNAAMAALEEKEDSDKPGDSDKTGDSEKPETPTTPEKPENGADTPATGDVTSVWMIIVIMGVALVSGLLAIRRKRR